MMPLKRLLLLPLVITAAEFEPYQLNGGLVSAIAGKNYCLLAADTRMMDGGYQIYTRNLLRLWGLSRDDALSMPELNGDESISTTTSSTTTTTLIGAAGCQSDCSALQRQLSFQARARPDDSQLSPSNVAQLLSQTLYSRRGFPYYAFCVVGGLSSSSSTTAVDDNSAVGGSVYVYDAIGSMEQVAIGTAGTGRELLQPILDRLFSSSCGTVVDDTSEEAIVKLTQAYHAVTERDIGVGDSLVLCLLERQEDGTRRRRMIRVPLKQH